MQSQQQPDSALGVGDRVQVLLPPAVRDGATLVLSSTRAIRRRLDPDVPVDPGTIDHAIEVAQRAPKAGGEAILSWVVVADRDRIEAVGALYGEAFADLDRERGGDSGVSSPRIRRIRHSSRQLAGELRNAPLLIVPCVEQEPPTDGSLAIQARYWASVYPAVWSLQLALRTQGLGSCMTTVGLRRHDDIREVLGLRADLTLAAILPVGHITGRTLRLSSTGDSKPIWI